MVNLSPKRMTRTDTPPPPPTFSPLNRDSTRPNYASYRGGPMHRNTHPHDWYPTSWSRKIAAHQTVYEDREAVERATEKLAGFPPLVTSGEIEHLKSHLAEAQTGHRFILQGGDCAERLDECRSDIITNKLKVLLQMSLVLIHGMRMPVVRIGRFAGQYAKPRSSSTETRDGITLPSYFGDLVNGWEFNEQSRRPDPHLMVRGYQHAAVTLNFIRSLIDGGFADFHHPERWDLSFLDHGSVDESARARYQAMASELAGALTFMEALGDRTMDDLTRVDFFTSHEGLNLLYESAQTRTVPRRDGHYNLTTHLPWIGERTRALDGAHVEYFRGIRNPVGIKIGPSADPAEIITLIETLNPADEPGKIVLIHRMGAAKIREALPPILRAVDASGKRVLWITDPMHGNTVSTPSGIKTRPFDAILDEIKGAFDAHESVGTRLGGVHFELTGEDVTECVGGATDVTEDSLHENYVSQCDPRLNYQQSLQMAFLIAERAKGK